ncbi:MAG: trypsin-like peptidase domain-containing protein [Myxococcota bacterium]|jgi:S1-C subfamily serine protease|nr:trypsin-like peptidase domain-containing protein [Myxococcota bacterium]
MQSRRYEKRRGLRARTAWRARRGARAAAVGIGLAVAGVFAFSPPQPARAADPFLRRTAAVEVVERVGPAVVNITTVVEDRSFPERRTGRDPFFRDFEHPRRSGRDVQMLGSGVIIDEERHVLTNAHVIADSARIFVSLADGKEYPALLVGAAPNNDLAVLQIETDAPLPWVAPGRSDDLMVGEPVIAIGNPFGLFSNTVTTGVLSAIDRSLSVEGDYYYGFLQTDASINPGNSGGPLLNAEGSLIGINTAIYRGGQGIGLAIPIDTAKRVVAELLEHGEIPPPWIGVEFKNLDPELRDVMRLPDRVSGALVTHVEPDSPAERGGLKRGDLVIAVDGHRVERDRSFFEALKTTLVGQAIELEIWRNGDTQKLRVVGIDLPDHIVRDLAAQFLGMKLQRATGPGYGIRELRDDYPAHEFGIAAGDTILAINGRVLRNKDDLRRAMVDLRRDYAATQARNRVLLDVRRGNARRHFSLPSYEAYTALRRLRPR